LVALAGGAVACGTTGSSGSAGRPESTAKLTIVSPTPGQVTGPSPTLTLTLTGGQIVPFTNLRVVPNQGHVHVYVDNVLVSMTLGLSQPLGPLSAGLHTVRAEFVASDHLPWRTRIVTNVVFTVQ
jgi:hypothetical protein